ncbi:glycosyltransferase family 21 protein [Xylaria bambusicola]|uniref:glycosyltransferase family 21 protein n=1 Tax=Xylaria bambusicola TaxID=326684 RepID=UPI002007E22B|nr:glycosyltransferase family 21 protein [Xylaria bambusicola]KAI0508989.1 glycosyltransferase family 21 protein [Xylaria bambusicola]
MHTIIYLLACVGLFWGCLVLVVQGLGTFTLFRNYSSIPKKPVSPTLPKHEIPHVTIIRPAKGLEPGLYECLASVFHQTYPRDKLTIYFCVESRQDPAYPVLCKLVADFPDFDAKVFIETDDPYLTEEQAEANNIGPNPKIRNVSRAYREAKGDIVWPIDCNIWIAKDVAGRMVDKLCGFLPDGRRAKPFKFVHQLPLVVDTVTSMSHVGTEGQALLSSASVTGGSGTGDVGVPSSVLSRSWAHGGGRLEEMFMATTHAKFYCAINTVGIAPCIVGKSNMFRKSHLDDATDPARNPILAQKSIPLPKGIDHFSSYMCEDHVIGDLLWRTDIPGFANHGLVYGDLAIQPMAGMSIRAYTARRVRWLRARKWTVLSATLVEHGVESLVCCFYLSFGLTTVPVVHDKLGIPQTWSALLWCWVLGVTVWILVDRAVFKRLHAGLSISVDDDTPAFARGSSRGGAEKRLFGEWLLAWVGREVLALPIWTWAVFLGTGVNWRGRQFRVRSDMTVVAMDEDTKDAKGRSAQAANRIGGRKID